MNRNDGILGSLAEEALFGRDANEKNIEDAASEPARTEFALIAARLSLLRFQSRLGSDARHVEDEEPIPEELRSKIQASAFAHFDQEVIAPPPSATTTGANVVEMVPVSRRRSGSSSIWTMLAFAAAMAAAAIIYMRSSQVDLTTNPTMASSEELRATSGGIEARLERRGDTSVVVVSGDEASIVKLNVYFSRRGEGAPYWVRGPSLARQDRSWIAELRAPDIMGFALTPFDDPESAPLRAVRER
jgi:hypothetical protein